MMVVTNTVLDSVLAQQRETGNFPRSHCASRGSDAKSDNQDGDLSAEESVPFLEHATADLCYEYLLCWATE